MEPLTIASFALSLIALGASVTTYRAVSRVRCEQDS
jgi:hypothetical protein